MIGILQNLLELQGIDFGDGSTKAAEARKEELRKMIPHPILGHYDRLVSRGKKGVALVRNQVCTGCHMRLPIGTVNTLMQAQDIQLCDTCGRYLSLAPAAEPEAPPPVPVAKPRAKAKTAPKTRKRKTLVPVD